MTPERWERVKDVLSQVLDLMGSEREAELLRLTWDDQSLFNEVQHLLASDQSIMDSYESRICTLATQTFYIEVAPPEFVGSYKILKEIGIGATASVYLAENTLSRNAVAIKVFDFQPGGDLTGFYEAEVRALEALNHDNIVDIIGHGKLASGKPYILMEYIEGVSILDFCEEHRVSLQMKLKLFVLVSKAVEYAHRRGVVHCDIKPGNILVEEGVRPVVLDFGIALSISEGAASETKGNIYSGLRPMTVHYASPEQVSGADIGKLTDVYSLGVLLFELVAKQSLYPSDQPRSVLREEILKGVERGPNAIQGKDGETAEELDAIVLRALSKDPLQRYKTVGSLAQDVESFLKNRPVHAFRRNMAYRVKKTLGRLLPGFGQSNRKKYLGMV